ncbi:MAG TPA: ribosome maturation factor RimM [Burkholderiales bacterium]|jgi:16S rRNA processing protein RimM|nr:ribosome maturation factor RimM [Burkholderiales bacterium]
MGRVVAPFGVRGRLRIQPYTAQAGNLGHYATWWMGRDGEWRPHAVIRAEVHGKGLIAELAGCNDRDTAAVFSGLNVAVPRVALPQPAENEFYWTDLIGLDVVNGEGLALGRVTDILRTGANDVLVTNGERERMIPFIDDVIRAVDPDAGVIRVDWGADY